MLERHEHDAIGALTVLQQPRGQLLGIEAFHVMHSALHVLRGPLVVREFDVVAEHAQIAVGARGQQKGDVHRLRGGGFVGGFGRIERIAELRRRLRHARGRVRSHAGSAVQYAIDGRAGDAGRLRDVGHARAGRKERAHNIQESLSLITLSIKHHQKPSFCVFDVIQPRP